MRECEILFSNGNKKRERKNLLEALVIVLDRFFYPVKNWKKKCLQKALVFADIVQIFLASEKFPQKKVFKCLKKNLQEAFMFASIGEIFLSSANFPQKNVLKKFLTINLQVVFASIGEILGQSKPQCPACRCRGCH